MAVAVGFPFSAASMSASRVDTLGVATRPDLDDDLTIVEDDVVVETHADAGSPAPRIPAWVWVAAILVAATLIRIWQLNRIGFNSDETVYAGQAASIAGNVTLQKFFPIYRAHPLLFQTLLSGIYRMPPT